VTGEERVFELLSKLETEQRNPASERLSEMDTIEILRVINEEDKKVAYAVEKALPEIAKLVEAIFEAVRSGGRWIYVGAGTSGRLAAIDVAELLSTYDVGPEVVEALVAGGPGAMVRPIEGAEDDEEMAVRELKARRVCEKDVVVGISASGRTPYVVSALKYAKSVGARTAAITCVENSPATEYADIIVAVKTGPEVITGSTRMKAGTAQKMVLTMLSTAVMVKLGRVYGNLMVALQPVSQKLRERAKRIIMMELASATMRLPDPGGAKYDVVAAIVMAVAGVSYEEAVQLLQQTGYIPTRAVELAKKLRDTVS
jgi:N-acetylmuramic acid 6-phosphate etherase